MIFIYVTAKDKDEADKLAHLVLEKKYAAAVEDYTHIES